MKEDSMHKRSNKIQFLFWAAFFATLFSVWIAFILFSSSFASFINNASIKLLFVLYFLVAFFSLAGLVLATLINNRFYERYFSFIIFLLFISLLIIRSFTD